MKKKQKRKKKKSFSSFIRYPRSILTLQDVSELKFIWMPQQISELELGWRAHTIASFQQSRKLLCGSSSLNLSGESTEHEHGHGHGHERGNCPTHTFIAFNSTNFLLYSDLCVFFSFFFHLLNKVDNLFCQFEFKWYLVHTIDYHDNTIWSEEASMPTLYTSEISFFGKWDENGTNKTSSI